MKNWHDARNSCRELHGNFDLVSITSYSENRFIMDVVSRLRKWYWIGLHDIEQEGNFSWTDGSLTPFGSQHHTHPWKSTEPNNVIKNYFKFSN